MPKFIKKRWHGNHMNFALLLIVLLNVCLSVYEWKFSIIGILILGSAFYYLYQAERSFQKDFVQYVSTLTYRIENAGRTVLDQLPLGILLYDKDGKIEWVNPFVKKLVPNEVIGVHVEEIFHHLKGIEEEKKDSFRIQVNERTLEVVQDSNNRFYFFQDVSKLDQLEKQYIKEQVVLGFLHVDNFDEAGQDMSDQENTILLSAVTSAISKWALENKLTLKRFDTEKMFFVTQNDSLNQLIQNKFEILDDVREMTRKNKIPITLSIGISNIGETIIEKTKNAQSALDMALARGGDQAAVRNGEQIIFFGGKTNAMEKRTRVRARVISHAMRNLIRDSERVIVMGHVQPDMDALGSAIGVVRFCLANDRDAYIVLDESNHFIDRLLEGIKQHEYLKDHLISPDKASQWIDDSETLLVLVDTHKPSLVLSPSLMERAQRKVVIDHHRRGEDFIEDPVLVYLEPYASSTCELVTELLQYQDSELGMDTLEATALFAGIVVDTKNFAFRAGSRTFEAASFLRRHGADLAMVQSLLKEDLFQFVRRAEIVKNTELLSKEADIDLGDLKEIAIAYGEENETYDQLIIAQAADTLLNMQGVAASFIIAQRNDDVISVSARSQGELNVQVIMEQLGGGGHLTHAASQMKESSMKEVRNQLLEVIKNHTTRGEK